MGHRYFKGQAVTKDRQKPSRDLLVGMSCSEFKTALKRAGFKVRRDFFKRGSRAVKGNRFYRFRWWSNGFICDISCEKKDFDRWANSVEKIVKVTPHSILNGDFHV